MGCVSDAAREREIFPRVSIFGSGLSTDFFRAEA